MPRYLSIYRWKPETAAAFAKKWLEFSTNKALQAAASKLKEVSLNFSVGNNCAVYIYDVDDADLDALNLCALHLADVCEMETIPLMTPEVHGKSFEEYVKLFPEMMK